MDSKSNDYIGVALRCSLFFLFITFSAWGIAGVSAPTQDPELQSFLSYYKTIERLQVSFHQVKQMKELKMTLKSEGQLRIQRPDQVVWEITSPSRLLATLTSESVSLETGEGDSKTVQSLSRQELSERKETQGLQSLISWLQMDPQVLAQDYRVSKLGPAHFEFDPVRKESSPFEKMEMRLWQGKHIQKLVLFEKSGDRIEIVFDIPKVTLKK